MTKTQCRIEETWTPAVGPVNVRGKAPPPPHPEAANRVDRGSIVSKLAKSPPAGRNQNCSRKLRPETFGVLRHLSHSDEPAVWTREQNLCLCVCMRVRFRLYEYIQTWRGDSGFCIAFILRPYNFSRARTFRNGRDRFLRL